MANTFNPILQNRELKTLSASNPNPSPAPGRAIVLAGKSQPMMVVRHGERGAPTRGQLMLGKYNWFYEIDVTEQHLSFDELLQSSDNISAFRAAINLSCFVRDPALIVENNITDALREIRPSIGEAMAEITIRYGIEELNQVRQEMRRINLARTAHSGFNISRLSFNLTLTKEAEKIANTRVLQRLEHQNTLERAGYEDDLKDKKAQRTRRLMREGVESLLAEHLTNNPNEMLNVAKMLYDQRQKEQELLKIADSIEDPHIRNVMIEKLTGKPIAELTSGSGSSNDQADYETIVEDDGDIPDEFRRD
jgi:hypothetical protein